ncbi:ACP S-malonyltransferase [Ornithinimicrobium tianjinense]|uniref:[acyl-carrier-protein] S-malonyltransferase n=1 Tax=Ornithinimicrobium tianjinense TaxID=1195761 RepID=A0A917BM38_9MICO|nr:ACP S-malonyltransferase [Ornithinimicrobium tianjinense]GGF49004.1 ACP S-malonyltransferase [Ornithinimicrobium tianjinense]
MLVIVAPGQGSQTPGFLSPWLELPGAQDHLASLSELSGLDLVAHGTTSDAETIKDTAVAQPLIVGAGLLTLAALDLPGGPTGGAVGALAGHSVGEITAAAAAGVLTEEQALVFVRERGRGMAEASALTPTGMSAVVGGDPDEVSAAIESCGLTPANMNSAGQVVAAGTLEQLSSLAAAPPARARVIPLQVAGAFHTHHMSPAVDRLRALAEGMEVSDPGVTLLSNADGAAVTSGREALDRLVSQVSNPVRWDLTMETFAALGVTGMIELSPAGTLVGLAKRALKGVELLALKTPDDLEAARRMVTEHATTTQEDTP